MADGASSPMLGLMAPRPGLEPGTCGLTEGAKCTTCCLLARPHSHSTAKPRRLRHVFPTPSAIAYCSPPLNCLGAETKPNYALYDLRSETLQIVITLDW